MNPLVLSRLRIVNVDQMLSYEWSDSEVDSSFEQSEEPRLVRHPFLVTPLESGDYLLLDQAEDFFRLRGIGLSFLPVLVIDSAQVTIKAEKIGLVNFGLPDLKRVIEKHPEQIIADEKLLSKRESQFLPVSIHFEENEEIRLWLRHSSQAGCPKPLSQLFQAINETGRYLPVVERRQNLDSVTKAGPFSAFISLPAFSLDDLKKAAQNDCFFPPHLISLVSKYRVLNIDFPVTVLRADTSTVEKEEFLRELVVLREQSRKTSFYEGQVYLLNQ